MKLKTIGILTIVGLVIAVGTLGFLMYTHFHKEDDASTQNARTKAIDPMIDADIIE